VLEWWTKEADESMGRTLLMKAATSRVQACLLACTIIIATLVGTASAECAWVLWLERGNGWEIVRAFGGLTECEELLGRLDAANVRAWKEKKKNLGSYVCLPDTIDPRGPKAK
jgi:hypothetical protein